MFFRPVCGIIYRTIIWCALWRTSWSSWIWVTSQRRTRVGLPGLSHPALLVSLLFYGYATGVFSSRKLEKASYDSIAFRYICANTNPEHDTIASFRKRFLKELGALFVEILVVGEAMGRVELGTVSLDGTKIKANASKHKALSWEYANRVRGATQARGRRTDASCRRDRSVLATGGDGYS